MTVWPIPAPMMYSDFLTDGIGALQVAVPAGIMTVSPG
jgi:hypothetical protein